MILVDTSVWIEHFRRREARLVTLLEETMVLTDPFVIGELALGQLQQKHEILNLLGSLPSTRMASHRETLAMIDRRDLAGSGIGWVDAHLLAAALLSDAFLWTLDRKLATVAKHLGVAPSL